MSKREQRFGRLNVEIVKGQYDMLTELSALTGQPKSWLVREALVSLVPLYQRLKKEAGETK